MLPTNESLEIRNGAYYVAGTRIGLDVIIEEFRNGRSVEAIFEAYPSIGSFEKTSRVIAFLVEHPKEVESYLSDQAQRWKEFQAQSPADRDMVERFERGKRELTVERP